MTPPETILDRWVKTELRNPKYLGKLDIERVEPPSLRSFLYLIQETMNEALRLEGVNASGGVEHPPFHFDYLNVGEEVLNAHAFQYANFSFIAVTLPMVELLWELSQRLSRSSLVAELLGLDPRAVDPDAIQELLFTIQLSFLVSHEYAHHIHRHCVESQNSVIGLWTEFPQDATSGDINSQAQELIADGYACYLVLAHLFRGDMRHVALAELGRTDNPGTAGDELLLTCFFLAVLAFFCAIWSKDIDMASVRQLTHPPPPVRIKYAINVAEMWCGQNGSAPQSWFDVSRLQALFRTAAEVIGESVRQTWDAQMAFLRSADGEQYDRQLFERFEALRQSRTI